MLKIENLSFSYRYEKTIQEVLHNLSFTVDRGENVGLIGANGVGKSTLLKLLVGILEKYEGSITMDDLAMNKKNRNEIRRKIGYVFQDSDHQLFMNTVYDDVAFGPRNYGLSEKEVEEKTLWALSEVNMTHLKDRPIYRLSGGEKKRAAIATVLSMGVQMILFDEPSVALDPKNRRNLIEVLNRLPVSKLIASHDLDFIQKTCQRTILMWDGRIVADGPTEEILGDKELLDRYDL